MLIYAGDRITRMYSPFTGENSNPLYPSTRILLEFHSFRLVVVTLKEDLGSGSPTWRELRVVIRTISTQSFFYLYNL